MKMGVFGFFVRGSLSHYYNSKLISWMRNWYFPDYRLKCTKLSYWFMLKLFDVFVYNIGNSFIYCIILNFIHEKGNIIDTFKRMETMGYNILWSFILFPFFQSFD